MHFLFKGDFIVNPLEYYLLYNPLKTCNSYILIPLKANVMVLRKIVKF